MTSTLDPTNPGGTLDRIRQLQPTAGHHVPRQHTVSRVVLKNYAAPRSSKYRGSLGRVDLTRASLKPTWRGPHGCGYVDDFVVFSSRSLEHLWSETEAKLGDAIAACIHNLYPDPNQIQVLKDAVALHFVRSVHSPAKLDQIWEENLQELRRKILTTQRARLESAFRELHGGLHPAGQDGLSLVFDSLTAPMVELHNNGAFRRTSLERLLHVARRQLDPLKVEICRSESEFVIGDAPVIARATDGRLGLREGVALGDANLIAMPVHPDVLISLSITPASPVLNREQTEYMNGLQVLAAHREVYFRPDGDGLDSIRRAAQLAGLGTHSRAKPREPE